MNSGSPTWRTLSAYVDGELDASGAAAVAEAAGTEPGVAAQIGLLFRLKGATHAALAAPPADFDLARLLEQKRRPRPRWPWAAAAAMVLVALLTAGGWLWLRPQQSTLPPDLLATARSLHTDWLNSNASGSAGDRPATLIAALGRFRQLPEIPDLESAKLTIDRVIFAERPTGDVLQVGYRGTHGCHLSLFVFADEAMPQTLVRVDIGIERAYGWQVGRLGYMLFAKGMDGARFDLIAHKVEEGTRTHAPFDSRTRQALEESKRHSTSCLA
jgi:anti-sigma factor RsiW